MSNHQQVSSRDRATGQAQPGPQPRTAPMGDGANGDCGADYEDSSPERSGGHDDAPDHRAGVDAGPVSRQAPQPAPRRLLHGDGAPNFRDDPAELRPEGVVSGEGIRTFEAFAMDL